jgi:hypothetical protein
MNLYSKPLYHLAKYLEKSEVIPVIMEDFPPFISSGQNVIKGLQDSLSVAPVP